VVYTKSVFFFFRCFFSYILFMPFPQGPEEEKLDQAGALCSPPPPPLNPPLPPLKPPHMKLPLPLKPPSPWASL
jgi:hypothetical protein